MLRGALLIALALLSGSASARARFNHVCHATICVFFWPSRGQQQIAASLPSAPSCTEPPRSFKNIHGYLKFPRLPALSNSAPALRGSFRPSNLRVISEGCLNDSNSLSQKRAPSVTDDSELPLKLKLEVQLSCHPPDLLGDRGFVSP